MEAQINYIHPAVYDSQELRLKIMNSVHSELPDRLMKGKSYNTNNKPRNARSQAYPNKQQGIAQPKEADMSDVTRDEIQALLKANKAEVESVSNEMRREMADFRTHYTQQFSSIEKGISEIKGEIGGLKTSLTTTQWSMTIGLGLVTVVLSGVMLVSSWIISSKESSTPQQQATQPIVIQVPQQPQIQQPTPAQQSQKN